MKDKLTSIAEWQALPEPSFPSLKSADEKAPSTRCIRWDSWLLSRKTVSGPV